MKIFLTIALAVSVLSCNDSGQKGTDNKSNYLVDPALPWSQRMAETIMIDFPDTDIQQFVSGTPLPFPALVWAVDTALEKTIQNALNPKNL